LTAAIAGLLGLALVLIAPASAFGAGWLAAGQISTIGSSAAHVAMAPDGTVVAAWKRGSRIEATVRPAGGGFGAAEFVSPVNGAASDPRVAIGASGVAAVVWVRQLDSASDRVEATVRLPGGNFGPVQTLQQVSDVTDISESVSQPRVAIDELGNVVVIWQHSMVVTPAPGSNASSIEAAEGTSAGFEAEQEIGSASGANADTVLLKDPAVTFDSEGRAVAVWVRETNIAGHPPERDIERTVKSAGDPLPGPSEVKEVRPSSAGAQDVPALAADGQGDVFIVWRAGSEVWGAALRPGGLTMPGALTLSGNAGNPGPQVAADNGGTAVAIWANEVLNQLQWTFWPAGGSFFAGIDPVPDQAAGQLLEPSLATDASGNTIAVWRHSALGIRASIRSPDGAFAGPVTISAPTTTASEPEIAADAQGDAVAIWNRDGTIEAAFYDGDPPPGSPVGASPSAPQVSDSSAPVVQSLKIARKRFAVGAQQTALNAARRRRTPRGTTFRYSLSEPATVRIAIDRLRPGRRVGSKCRRPTRRLAKKRRCTRIVATGSLTRNSRAGANSTPFSGRIGKKALRPGRYRATVTATDGAGNRSKARRVSFNVVRF
jgi:hypothetical protein